MGCGNSTSKADAAMAAPMLLAEEYGIPEGDFKISLTHVSYSMKASVLEELGVVASFPKKKYILVESIRQEGLIPSWNKDNENTPELQVKPGDAFVIVNGLYGNSEFMVAKAKETFLTLTVKRGNAGAGTTEQEPLELLALPEPAPEPPAKTLLQAPRPAQAPAWASEKPSDAAAISTEEATSAAAAEATAVELTVAEAPSSDKSRYVDLVFKCNNWGVNADYQRESTTGEVDADDAKDEQLCKFSIC